MGAVQSIFNSRLCIKYGCIEAGHCQLKLQGASLARVALPDWFAEAVCYCFQIVSYAVVQADSAGVDHGTYCQFVHVEAWPGIIQLTALSQSNHLRATNTASAYCVTVMR